MGAVEASRQHMSRAIWSSRRVLITGATGMVGSWLVKELLNEQAYIVALVFDADPQSELYRSSDVTRVSVVSGRLQDIETLERTIVLHEIDTVFHLGAQTLVGAARRAPLYTFEANIRGTYTLLEACRRHPDLVQCVVVASSDKAYGEQALPYLEEAPLLGREPYEVSKSCADMLAQTYHHAYGLPVTIARCGNIYGGGDLNWSRVVPGTIRDFFNERRPVIRSDGTFIRDYIYVKDAVAAYKSLADAMKTADVAGRAFNFSDESPSTVLQIVAVIQRLMGRDGVELDIRNQAKGEIHDQWISAERARTVLGWRPQYTLEAGLLETIEWYGEFFGVKRNPAVIG